MTDITITENPMTSLAITEDAITYPITSNPSTDTANKLARCPTTREKTTFSAPPGLLEIP